MKLFSIAAFALALLAGCSTTNHQNAGGTGADYGATGAYGPYTTAYGPGPGNAMNVGDRGALIIPKP